MTLEQSVSAVSDSHSKWPIQPAFRFGDMTEEELTFTKQLGVDSVIMQSLESDNKLLRASENEFSLPDLVRFRNRIESYGLSLGAIENLPRRFYDNIVLGQSGREAELEHVKNTIRNMGKAGIPVLGYNWLPNGVWRTSKHYPGRGGAKATAYDHSEVESAPLTHGREYTEAEFWDNYEYFLEEVLPVAEEAGVTLCLHPDDPPVKQLGGIPRLFRNFENLKRAMNLVESDNHGLEFCLGTISSMDQDADPVDVIRYFGERDEIVYVHFRDVAGTVPAFHEVFLDEDSGNFDEYQLLRVLDEVGFSGMIIPDHQPRLSGEPDWQPRGRAYSMGLIKGMLRALYAEQSPA